MKSSSPSTVDKKPCFIMKFILCSKLQSKILGIFELGKLRPIVCSKLLTAQSVVVIFVGTRWGNCSYSSDGCRSHLFDYSAVWHQSVAHADENNQQSCPETVSSASGRGGQLSCQVSKGQDGPWMMISSGS